VDYDTRPLRNRDDALRLQDLVYTAYGLTYHRSFMYEPDALLELNARGQIRSMLAVDRSTGAVIGHLGSIRPWFEMLTVEEQLRPTTSVELGLSIVHPERRAQAIQNTLGLATALHERSVNPNLRSMFTKCLTAHLMSQRSSRRMGGRAGALFLGGVPGWVIRDSERGPVPMTTVLFHTAMTEYIQRAYVPEHWADWVRLLLEPSNQRREVIGVPCDGVRLPSGETQMRTWFEPSRRCGVVRVCTAGQDLVAEVLGKVAWMTRGHMEHISVLLPLDVPEIAAAVPHLEDAGLFLGGYVPDIDGRDCLLLEWQTCDAIDIGKIEVIGDEAFMLLDTVAREWRRANHLNQAPKLQIALAV
jgi:hypothetical protein